jgi:RHS repeat-associated protein
MAIPDGRVVLDTYNNFQYEFEYRDHLGNLRLSYRDTTSGSPTIREAAVVSQTADYMPFGVEHFGNTYSLDSLNKQNFTYSNKEKQDDFGISSSYFGARNYNSTIGRFLSVDPLASEMPEWSPYTFEFNNPLRYLDPDGRKPVDIIIKGYERQAAFSGLQASVQGQLALSMSASGKVSYSQIGSGKLSKGASQLVNAIDDNSIVVNLNSENTTQTKSGALYIGGAFSGNTVTGESVVAEQEINPSVLNTMSNVHGKPGVDVLHEATEAYQGALISQKRGKSSAAAGQSGSTYTKAHNRATKQSGQVHERIYDASGNVMNMNAQGGYPKGVRSADYYVQDKKGNKTVIQTVE